MSLQRVLLGTDSIGQFVDTFRTLVGREFRMRYKGSVLGILWATLSPLGTVVILQFVFTRVLAIPIPNFAAFLYSGILPWVWFSTAVQGGATTLTENRDLVRTPFFTKSLLPAVITCSNFVMYLFAFPVLLGLILVDNLPLTRALLALPAIWIVQGLLTLSFTVLVAAVGVLVRDVAHLMGIILTFWFYLTPIFYDLKQAPGNSARWLALNPMSAMVSAHREVVLYGRFPDWTELGTWMVIALALFGLSIAVFRGLEDTFIDQA
jgi:lipopolysaccharide transport system permease protein